MNNSEQQTAIEKIATRAKTDAGFMKDLMENPTRILQENGVKFPAGSEFQVSADKDSNICVSACSANGELSEEDLTEISGGLRIIRRGVADDSI